MSKERKLPDFIQPSVKILFVGINPGLRSALVGHHFAGYSNRFWKLLSDARLVPTPLTYHDDWRLPEWGFGITNIVERPTAGVNGLTAKDYQLGQRRLLAKIRRYGPEVVALLGMTLYSVLFPEHSATGNPTEGRTRKRHIGLQPQKLADARVFLLPNPSGRNAHYSYQEMLQAFMELKTFLQANEGHPPENGLRQKSFRK